MGDEAAVRDAIAALARSFKRVSVFRHARDQHGGYLEPALAEMRSLLEMKPSVTVQVEPTALVYEGATVHSEPARENGFCFRLHRDGVRSLTFRRGLGLGELVSLAYVAMADPQLEDGREDAVTELWKADLAHVGYSAGAGYRMDESAGETMTGTVGEIAGRVQQVLEPCVGDRFAEVSPQPLLWDDAQRRRKDPDDHPGLARRAALTILRIVEQDHAGWDLAALQESFWRLIDQMIDRREPQPLAQALDRARTLSGSHAAEFRQAVGQRMAEPARFERAVAISTGAERPPLVSTWVQLLPAEAGPALVAALGQGRDSAARRQIAEAALSRFQSCAAQLDQVVRKGSAEEVEAVLSALAPLPPARRAELAAIAFENPDARVKLAAIPLVAADPPTAVKALAGAVASADRGVRVAAAQALAGTSGVAEQASNLLLTAMARPQFAGADKEEQTAFYRALGKLGATSGFSFLSERLAQPPRKLFGRRKAIDEQLLAVQGLAEEGTRRSLRALEEAQQPANGHASAVLAACRAAAQHLRERERTKGGKTA